MQKRELYFGQAETYDNDDNVIATEPIVVARVGASWMALSLADPRIDNAEWLFNAAGPKAGEIWGVLDDQIDEKSAAVLLLAHSSDAGQTWTITPLPKQNGTRFGKSAATFMLSQMMRGRHIRS